jgi:hypothetical protein
MDDGAGSFLDLAAEFGNLLVSDGFRLVPGIRALQPPRDSRAF